MHPLGTSKRYSFCYAYRYAIQLQHHVFIVFVSSKARSRRTLSPPHFSSKHLISLDFLLGRIVKVRNAVQFGVFAVPRYSNIADRVQRVRGFGWSVRICVRVFPSCLDRLSFPAAFGCGWFLVVLGVWCVRVREGVKQAARGLVGPARWRPAPRLCRARASGAPDRGPEPFGLVGLVGWMFGHVASCPG